MEFANRHISKVYQLTCCNANHQFRSRFLSFLNLKITIITPSFSDRDLIENTLYRVFKRFNINIIKASHIYLFYSIQNSTIFFSIRNFKCQLFQYQKPPNSESKTKKIKTFYQKMYFCSYATA